MEKEYYLINEAAKEVHVEAHVLRYWEEELGLPIKRNKKGHRLYTAEDVSRLIRVKKLKEEGLQLKAVKKIIEAPENNEKDKNQMKVVNFHVKDSMQEEKQDKVSDIIAGFQEEKRETEESATMAIEIKNVEMIKPSLESCPDICHQKESVDNTREMSEEKARKVMRMQALLKRFIEDTVVQNQKKMETDIRENLTKELDYQFRQLEERQEEIEKRRVEREEKREKERREQEEKHYKELDELIRGVVSKRKRKKLS